MKDTQNPAPGGSDKGTLTEKIRMAMEVNCVKEQRCKDTQLVPGPTEDQRSRQAGHGN